MRRVCIVGASGSGKTTLAREIARRLDVPHIDMDALHHGPNWSEPTAEAYRAVIEPLIAREGWVADSLYSGKLGDMVPLAADTVIWLDLPFAVTMWRLLRRTLSRLWHRTELWNGNRESLRGAFWGRESLFGWAIARHREYRRTLPVRFATPEFAGKRIVRVRSDADVKRLLSGL